MKLSLQDELDIYNLRVENFYEQSTIYGSRETLILLEISKTNILRLLEDSSQLGTIRQTKQEIIKALNNNNFI